MKRVSDLLVSLKNSEKPMWESACKSQSPELIPIAFVVDWNGYFPLYCAASEEHWTLPRFSFNFGRNLFRQMRDELTHSYGCHIPKYTTFYTLGSYEDIQPSIPYHRVHNIYALSLPSFPGNARLGLEPPGSVLAHRVTWSQFVTLLNDPKVKWTPHFREGVLSCLWECEQAVKYCVKWAVQHPPTPEEFKNYGKTLRS